MKNVVFLHSVFNNDVLPPQTDGSSPQKANMEGNANSAMFTALWRGLSGDNQIL
jgi:hypothetical protein